MSKEKEMVDLLRARTESGSLKWEPTAADDEFLTSVGGGASIFIRAQTARDPSDDTPDVLLSIRDKDDREVFSIYNGQDDVKYQDLRGLHELARRSALQIDKTIDEILQDLRREA